MIGQELEVKLSSEYNKQYELIKYTVKPFPVQNLP